MNLLFLIDSLGSGGAQRQLTNLAILMRQRGHEVRILTYYPLGFFRATLEENQIGFVCVDERRWWMRLWKIRQIIRKGRQDVVLSFLNTPNFFACVSAIGGRRWGLVIGERSAQQSSFTSFRGWFVKSVAGQADFIVTNSARARDLWVRYFPRFGRKLRTIYNAVVLSRVVAPIGEMWGDKKFRILVAASYQKLKNMNGLIEAINLLDDKHKQRLLVSWYGQMEATHGNDQPYKDAVRQVHRYQLGSVITLNSAVSDIHERMASSDIVGLFSFYEGLPNVICEAMALGKPIIMSRVSDTDVLVDDQNGFLCNAYDILSIAEAIKQAMDCSKEQLERMGTCSLKKASRLFQPNLVVDAYLGLFIEAAERAKGLR